MVMEHRPGDKLYVDFSSKKMHYIDRNTGEVIPCEIFVACLPFSDFAFVMAVRSQQTPDFLYALDCCLQSLGGVPQALVPDNLKAAVIKADRYEPTLNRCMEDFANHYGAVAVLLWCIDSFVLQNPPLRQVPKRYVPLLRNQHTI